jgi:hypothetical protein
MSVWIKILLGVAAAALLWGLLRWLIGFTWGLVNFAVGLFWLALLVAAIIFVVGLVRRLILR